MTKQTIAPASKLTPNKLQGWAKVNRQAVLNMVAARIHAAKERVQVDAYIEPLFQARHFVDAESCRVLTESKDLYLSQDDEGVAQFFAECDAAHRMHGFTGPEGHCPALIAENAAVQAENLVLRSIEPLLGVEVLDLDHRAKLLGIIVSMIEEAQYGQADAFKPGQRLVRSDGRTCVVVGPSVQRRASPGMTWVLFDGPVSDTAWTCDGELVANTALAKLDREFNTEALPKDLRAKLAQTVFLVEADSFAQHMLCNRYGTRPDSHKSWQQDPVGLAWTVGRFHGRPVVLSTSWFIIGGRRVGFYDCTSELVDWAMVEGWLDANLPHLAAQGDVKARRCEVNNFGECLNYLNEKSST